MQKVWEYGFLLRFLRFFAANPDLCNYLSSSGYRTWDLLPVPPFRYARWPWGGFRVALRWLWGGLWVAIPWLSTRFEVALRWLWVASGGFQGSRFKVQVGYWMFDVGCFCFRSQGSMFGVHHQLSEYNSPPAPPSSLQGSVPEKSNQG
jgi:hypothetical protein